MNSEYGERLKRARLLRGLTMQELGDKVGITKQAISKFEKGKIIPSGKTMVKIAEVLNLTLDYFFKSEDKKAKLTNIHWTPNWIR